MKRNNRYGDHSAYPMPKNYTGGSDNFSILRKQDGHAPLTIADTADDTPIIGPEDCNPHYPTAPDFEFPLGAFDGVDIEG